MKEFSRFAFELYVVCLPKKAQNSTRNDSGMAFQPHIISKSNKHDRVRRVVVEFSNKVCFRDDAIDHIPGCDGSTQFFNIRCEAVFTRRCVITFEGRRTILDEEVAQVILCTPSEVFRSARKDSRRSIECSRGISPNPTYYHEGTLLPR
jgi:hypothetical protein